MLLRDITLSTTLALVLSLSASESNAGIAEEVVFIVREAGNTSPAMKARAKQFVQRVGQEGISDHDLARLSSARGSSLYKAIDLLGQVRAANQAFKARPVPGPGAVAVVEEVADPGSMPLSPAARVAASRAKREMLRGLRNASVEAAAAARDAALGIGGSPAARAAASRARRAMLSDMVNADVAAAAAARDAALARGGAAVGEVVVVEEPDTPRRAPQAALGSPAQPAAAARDAALARRAARDAALARRAAQPAAAARDGAFGGGGAAVGEVLVVDAPRTPPRPSAQVSSPYGVGVGSPGMSREDHESIKREFREAYAARQARLSAGGGAGAASQSPAFKALADKLGEK